MGTVDLLLLAVFLAFNLFALRWCVRQLVLESDWLRDPELRAEALRIESLNQLRSRLLPFLSRGHRTDSPADKFLGALALIVILLWADYFTIRHQWPWLLGG
ncbi:MAG TPA: hypothetical protein VNO75_06115 [Gemmatimonadaceae bacterium]|nr:hypothetical protein [Gemmatimonadaceae bacterium]